MHLLDRKAAALGVKQTHLHCKQQELEPEPAVVFGFGLGC